MSQKPNSMQAVLDRAKAAEEQPPKVEVKLRKKIANDKPKKQVEKPGRAGTTLIGGHFAPEVARQLAIIAAEEGTTKQALLTEALDLLFVKKGKARVSKL